MKGTLYICPTPIGNLEDITLRTLRVLEEVDLIAAEDTRHTIKLLNHYKIQKPLTSYHDHNIREKGPELIRKLEEGTNIGLVSDAGMPGISDPGQDLIKEALINGIEVIGLPGPSASITALVISGLSTDQFIFFGFLSSKKKERLSQLEDIKAYDKTTIVYEAPHRLLGLLEDMDKVLGPRQISVSRELTKKFEETFRGTPIQALEKFQVQGVKGEFVIVIEGAKEDLDEEIDIKEALLRYLEDNYTKKEAVKLVAEKYGLGKNEVYKASLDL